MALDMKPNENGRAEHIELAEVFELGYTIRDMDFRIAIVDEMLRLVQEPKMFPTYYPAEAVYQESGCDALKQLVVDLRAWKMNERWDGADGLAHLVDWHDRRPIFAGDP